jgi:hypothetical protein
VNNASISINAPNIVLFVSRLALHWNLIRLRTGPSALACLDVYFPALKCLIIITCCQNLSDPISEIAFSRVRCDSLFRYIGYDWLKSDIGPSESPNAGHHSPGCHFELKQVGFTAEYLPRQCLLTSRNTFFRYSELGFWSHTGLNLAHGIFATLSGLYAYDDVDATPCLSCWVPLGSLARQAYGQVPPFKTCSPCLPLARLQIAFEGPPH